MTRMYKVKIEAVVKTSEDFDISTVKKTLCLGIKEFDIETDEEFFSRGAPDIKIVKETFEEVYELSKNGEEEKEMIKKKVKKWVNIHQKKI